MAKILIVDDDEQVTNLFEKFLTMEGYEAIGLNDSTRAVDLANLINPDLFLLDLMMPQPDGFKNCAECCAQTQSSNTHRSSSITALGDSDSRVVAFGAGADDYHQKPFHIEELAKRIKVFI